MGSSEERKPCKPEKPPSPTRDQNDVHAYPDWAMMQPYFGPRFAVPPYLNSVVAPQTPPPYMWVPPQSMIHPYGVPYAAYYAPGAIYGHPGVAMAGTAFSMDTSVKSSGNTDGSLKKKLKEGDGLAISIGNGHADSGEHGKDNRPLDSEENDDSSDGSNGSPVVAGQKSMKRSRPGSPNIAAANVKAQKKGSPKNLIETSQPANIPAKTEETIDAVLELKDPCGLDVKPIMNVPGEAWLQNERELKQERRKQSNRESARRSRLRKQAEAEQLTIKVQSLTTENLSLKSKIYDFKEICKKLELENAKLMDKLEGEEINFHKIDDLRLKPVGTANLLARVEHSYPNSRSNEEGNSYEKRKPVAKLHQLLDAIAGTRADAVAAS
ncbi:hypothetical protein ACS0TY_002412 [Phlomoides rotata]